MATGRYVTQSHEVLFCSSSRNSTPSRVAFQTFHFSPSDFLMKSGRAKADKDEAVPSVEIGVGTSAVAGDKGSGSVASLIIGTGTSALPGDDGSLWWATGNGAATSRVEDSDCCVTGGVVCFVPSEREPSPFKRSSGVKRTSLHLCNDSKAQTEPEHKTTSVLGRKQCRGCFFVWRLSFRRYGVVLLGKGIVRTGPSLNVPYFCLSFCVPVSDPTNYSPIRSSCLMTRK
jgi:hypothetical protein